MEQILSVKNLSYTYKAGRVNVKALDDLDLEICRGEIFGFIGPNGAGKTTTIKLILNILPLQNGKIKISGEDSSKPKTRLKVGYMPESAVYSRYLTPKELLYMYGRIFGIRKSLLKQRISELLALVDLEKEGSRLIGTFSKGMMQKVSFAQSLINEPSVLILDEPTSGLDPVLRKKMRETILNLRDAGKTIFFSSHELSEVELISDKIGILNKGRLLATGPTKSFMGKKEEGLSLENYFLNLIKEKQ
ncbi:MAG: ABC transporter ATP-binding protein [Candidatus Omnitrophica bacterium]|nr:ABC transporter ATP-binding protein [Candidatus Omnitrophota bacterium]